MSEEFRHSQVESLGGKVVIIQPSRLLNRGELYTTQNWIDSDKLNRALQGQLEDNSIASGWVLVKEGRNIFIVGDGNHRIGLACIIGDTVPFYVVGPWDDDKNKKHEIYGFNIIVNKIRDMGIGLSK